ncbi:unnamed protein product [Alopecurus aequalis]
MVFCRPQRPIFPLTLSSRFLLSYALSWLPMHSSMRDASLFRAAPALCHTSYC